TDQLTQGGTLADDGRIGADIRSRGTTHRQLTEVRKATDLIRKAFAVKILSQSHNTKWLVARSQPDHRAKDQAMIMPIEVSLADQLRNPLPCAVLQHNAAQHRLFRLDGMGWNF